MALAPFGNAGAEGHGQQGIWETPKSVQVETAEFALAAGSVLPKESATAMVSDLAMENRSVAGYLLVKGPAAPAGSGLAVNNLSAMGSVLVTVLSTATGFGSAVRCE